MDKALNAVNEIMHRVTLASSAIHDSTLWDDRSAPSGGATYQEWIEAAADEAREAIRQIGPSAIRAQAQADWTSRADEPLDAKTIAGIQIGYDRAIAAMDKAENEAA